MGQECKFTNKHQNFYEINFKKKPYLSILKIIQAICRGEWGWLNHFEVLFRLWAPQTRGLNENWCADTLTYTLLD